MKILDHFPPPPYHFPLHTHAPEAEGARLARRSMSPVTAVGGRYTSRGKHWWNKNAISSQSEKVVLAIYTDFKENEGTLPLSF